jgi:hypothetical protein
MLRATTLVLAAGLFACGGGRGGAGGGGGEVRSRDSAGIRIVENRGQAWADGKGWKVVDSPLVDIGGKGGEAAGDLDQVTGPVSLTDGRLVFANGATSEVRIYDRAALHLHTAGRKGSGPGEYQTFGGLWVGPGDSVLVADILARRMTVLDRDGNLGRSFVLAGQGGSFVSIGGQVSYALASGWFADGSVLGLTQAFQMNDPRAGVHRDSVTAVRYNGDGTVRDTLGRWPGAETTKMEMSFGGRTMTAPMPVPLGRQSTSLVRGERLYLARNDAWEIEVRNGDGKLLSLIRADVKAAPLTPADVAAHRKQQLAALAAQPLMRMAPAAIVAQLKQRIESATYPATLPFVQALLADPDGNLWVQEATSPADESARFAVVDSTGRLLGRVAMPARLKPTAIGADAVFGVWSDADEVQHVRSYPIRKR